MNAPDYPFDRFMAMTSHLTRFRPSSGDHRVYERLKAEFQRDVQDATPEQYEQAMRAAARAAGV